MLETSNNEAVNRIVAGSSPAGGAKQNGHHFGGRFCLLFRLSRINKFAQIATSRLFTVAKPSARSVRFSEANASATQKMILWIIFRRERVGIHDDPEYHSLSPQATFRASQARVF